jgi:hypothetical protein
MWSRQDSSADATDNFRRLRASFTEAYQVLHSVDATDFDIYSAQGLPYVGQPFPNTDFVLAQKGSIRKIGPILSHVIIKYEGEVAPLTSNGSPSSSPIAAAPMVRWSSVTESLEIDEDINGLPIATVIGEPLNGVRADFVDLVLTVERNFISWNTYLQSKYLHSVNSDEFEGWPAGTAKIKVLEANNVIDKVNGYWKATLQVQFRYPYRTTPERTWWARVRHEGYYERVKAEGPPDQNGNFPYTKVRMVDEHKKALTRPTGIKLDGTQAKTQEETVWLEFQRYRPLPYYSLGFL